MRCDSSSTLRSCLRLRISLSSWMQLWCALTIKLNVSLTRQSYDSPLSPTAIGIHIGHRGPGYALISSEQLHHTLIGRVVNTTISLRCCKQNVLKSRRQMPMQCFRFAFKYDGATTRSMAQWTAPKYSHPMKHGSAVARADAYDQRCTFLVCTHDM